MYANISIWDSLNLPVTDKDPDPFSISKISGFYGPGAWAGWFLTLCASWYSILTRWSKCKRTHDILMHLVFTNWAAIDLVRRLRPRAEELDDEHHTGDYGAIGAAITITYWGLWNAMLQLTITLFCFEEVRDKRRSWSRSTVQVYPVHMAKRCAVLSFGLFIPSFALVRLARRSPGLEDFENAFYPAFYYSDMNVSSHSWALMSACSVGFWGMTYMIMAIPSSVIVMLASCNQKRNESLDRPLSSVVASVFSSMSIVALFLSAFLFLFSTDTAKDVTGGGWRLFVFYPVILWCIMPAHLLLFTMTFFYPVLYALKVFYTRGRIIRDSCFFMPCAPQSIIEWDQAFGLVVGIFVLGAEVGPVLGHQILRLVRVTWRYAKRPGDTRPSPSGYTRLV
jgi:hypothetical protein